MKRCNQVRQIGYLYLSESNSQAGRVYDKYGISPTIDSGCGCNRQPKIIIAYDTD